MLVDFLYILVDEDISGPERLVISRNTLEGIDRVNFGCHRVKERAKLSALHPADVPNAQRALRRFGDPERMPIAFEEKLLSVYIPGGVVLGHGAEKTSVVVVCARGV